MIEEHARVVAIDGRSATLVVDRTSACGQCAKGAGCSTSVLSAWINRRQVALDLPIPPGMPAKVGDLALLGLDERAVQRGALLLYATPLAGLLIGAVSGPFVASSAGFSSELTSIVLGLFGLSAALVWISRRSGDQSKDSSHTIRILRFEPSTDLAPDVSLASLADQRGRGLHSE
ncbi:MAG: SoxR reducing system RseC family protein [Chromatiaceae bacterium]